MPVIQQTSGILETILCALGRFLIIVLLELVKLLAGLFFGPEAAAAIEECETAIENAECQLSL